MSATCSSGKEAIFLLIEINELTWTAEICTGGALVGVAGRGVMVF